MDSLDLEITIKFGCHTIFWNMNDMYEFTKGSHKYSKAIGNID
jgi:hypothetical protein